MMVLRVALTGESNTPDLHEIISLMGIDRVKERLLLAINFEEKQAGEI